MTISFISMGTGSETTAAWGTHTTNDLGILVVGTNNGTVTTPSGWTVIPGISSIAVPAGSISIAAFYRFATSSSEGAASLAGGASYLWGVIGVWRNVNMTNPIHVCSTGVGFSNTQHNLPGLTTYLDGCQVVGVWSYGADAASIVSSGLTNPSLGSLTERYTPTGTTTGTGGGVYIYDGTLATKASIPQTEFGMGTSTGAIGATIALQANDKTFDQRTLIVNNRKHAMPILCNQSTAQNFSILLVSAADGKSGLTGATVAWTLKKGGESSLSSISPTTTEIGSGQYDGAMTTTHMNTLGLASLRGTATSADPADCPNCIDVVSVDKQSATRGLSGTALPAVAAEGAGGLYTRGTGAGQIKQSANGQVDANLATWNLNGTSASTTVPKAMTAAGLVQASDGSGNAIAPASATTAIQADTDDIQTRLPAALTAGGNMKSDALAISGDTGAADALESQFDGTGLSGATYPATQAQGSSILERIASVAVTGTPSSTIASRTLTTGTETGTIANTKAEDGTYWDIDDDTGVISVLINFDDSATAGAIGTDVDFQGYLVGVANSLKVEAWDYVATAFKQIATITGTASAVVESDKWQLDNTMTSGGLRQIRISGTGLTSAKLRVDRMLGGYGIAPPTVAAIQSGLATASDQTAIKTKTDQLTFTVANQVDANALTGGGGGGGGTTGYGEQLVDRDATNPIHFTLLAADGSRATGAAAAILATISLNGGTPAAAAGGFFEIDAGDQPGEYYYLPDTGEDSAVGTIILYLTPDDFDFVAQSVMARVVDPTAATVDANVVSVDADAIDAAAIADDAYAALGVAVWSTILEGSHTAGDMVRGIVSNVSAKVSGFLTGVLKFRDLADTKDRTTVTTNADGRASSVANDSTDPGHP